MRRFANGPVSTSSRLSSAGAGGESRHVARSSPPDAVISGIMAQAMILSDEEGEGAQRHSVAESSVSGRITSSRTRPAPVDASCFSLDTGPALEY